MNERIQQLVKRASTTTTSYYDGRGNVTETYFDKEKFAELIVRECVRVCNKQIPNWKGEYATAFGDGVEFCISGIKEHFGVEE